MPRANAFKSRAFGNTAIDELVERGVKWVHFMGTGINAFDVERRALGRTNERVFSDNLQRYLAGEPLANVIDPARGYRCVASLSRCRSSSARAHRAPLLGGDFHL